MYTGEFKNGARYECKKYDKITYIGALGGNHYVLEDYDDDVKEYSEDFLRNYINKEIKTPKTITGYINFDKDGAISHVFSSRIEADREAFPYRTECVKVTIERIEGQFDE